MHYFLSIEKPYRNNNVNNCCPHTSIAGFRLSPNFLTNIFVKVVNYGKLDIRIKSLPIKLLFFLLYQQLYLTNSMLSRTKENFCRESDLNIVSFFVNHKLLWCENNRKIIYIYIRGKDQADQCYYWYKINWWISLSYWWYIDVQKSVRTLYNQPQKW